jgi:hypothetical protein
MDQAANRKKMVASGILPKAYAGMSGSPQGGVRGQRARVELSG